MNRNVASGGPAKTTTGAGTPVPPHADAPLWDREELFWTKGASTARQMSSKHAVFVFPDPTGVLQGAALWRETHVAQRWRSAVMSERHVCIQGDTAVLAYRVSADRDGEPIYEALCTSTYMKDNGEWLRLAHQQTPVT